MTKSKPKPVKPVRVWTLVDSDGCIKVAYCDGASLNYLRQLAKMDWNPKRRVIRVEIRPAPKRKSKRTKP